MKVEYVVRTREGEQCASRIKTQDEGQRARRWFDRFYPSDGPHVITERTTTERAIEPTPGAAEWMRRRDDAVRD